MTRFATACGAALAGLGRVLFPPRCLLCGLPGADGRDVCAECRDGLPWLRSACPRCALPRPAPDPAECPACVRDPPPQHAAFAAFAYAAPVDRLLPRLKFHADLSAGRLLSTWMHDALATAPRPGAIVTVPLHRARLRQRGFDQALELARPLARAFGLPLRADALVRRRATAPQTALDAAARRRNLRDAFACVARRPLPAHVALLDDVMTTGATLRDATRALHAAGVARVDLWVAARAPPPGSR